MTCTADFSRKREVRKFSYLTGEVTGGTQSVVTLRERPTLKPLWLLWF